MELRHIRAFLAVAAEQHFSRAAEKLGIAQPPLSQQIKALETEIGTRLFRRLPHGAELTEAGAAFLTKVGGIPNDIAEGARLAHRAAAGETGILRLGFTGTAALNPVVPACIRSFRHAYPDVELVIEEKNSAMLAAVLVEGRLDVAILRPTASDPQELAEEILTEERLVAALPAGHPVSCADTVDLAMLKDDPFILTPRDIGAGLHDAALNACRDAGFEARLAQFAPQIASILSLVAADLGVSLVPASLRQLNVRGVVLKELSSETRQIGLALAYRRSTTAIVTRNFVEQARRLKTAAV